jgi:ABC-type sugar transport system ATPase subunit
VGGGGRDVPDLTLRLPDVPVDSHRLSAYNRVCGFDERDTIPITYPHVLAFPLQLSLMTDPSFPFPAIGLVHIHNRITQHRPIRRSERLRIDVWATPIEDHPRGKQFSLHSEARVGEELVDHARLYGMSVADGRARGLELLSSLDLEGVWDRLTKTLSGGQRRRLDIAMGLVHSPRLIFLDEPSSGLDPQARANLWQHVRRLRDERGATAFLTTHYLEEADALCDRILVIDHGRIVAEGAPEELKRRLGRERIELAGAPAAELAAEVRRLVGVEPQRAEGGAGVSPLGVAVRRPTLDDVFLSLTGHALRDEVLA